MKKAIVFGASKGIGEAIALMLKKKDYMVTDISRTSGFDLLKPTVVPIKPETCEPIEAELFIYCAGVGYFHKEGKKYDNIREMILLNLELPILYALTTNAQHYIFIGSNSSYYGFEGSEVYCATKHGILGFARALRKSGKKVSVISPGTVNTRFWQGCGRPMPDVYQEAEDVAKAVITCIESNADIEELLITPCTRMSSSVEKSNAA